MKQVALILTLLFLSGCAHAQSRDCTSFNHPILIEFSGLNQGGELFFSSEDGHTLNLSVGSTWYKQPRTINEGEGGLDLTCHEFITATFQVQESPTWIRYELSHWDKPEAKFKDEALKIKLFVGRTGNTSALRVFSFTFNAADNKEVIASEPSEDEPEQTIEKLADVSIDNKTIADTVKVTLKNPKENGDSDSVTSLRTIFLSEQYGLLRIVLDSGTIYTRVWPSEK